MLYVCSVAIQKCDNQYYSFFTYICYMITDTNDIDKTTQEGRLLYALVLGVAKKENIKESSAIQALNTLADEVLGEETPEHYCQEFEFKIGVLRCENQCQECSLIDRLGNLF